MAMIVVHHAGVLYTIRVNGVGFRVVVVEDDGSERRVTSLHNREVVAACKQLLHAMDLHAMCNQCAEVGPANTEPLP